MKYLRHKKLWLSLFVACAFSFPSFSQSVTGIWRGYFVSDGGESYTLEFQVKQNSTSSVSGVSYSYLDIRFYGKATMTGNFIKTGNNFRIREIKTVEVKNIGLGGTCIMNYNLEYTRSGKEEFLEGTYLGKPETKDGQNSGEWGACGGGKVFLRKVPTSNFYVEPFLRKNDVAKTPRINPPVANTNPTTTKPRQVTPPPVVKKPVVKTNTPVNKPNNNQATVKKDPVIIVPRRMDSALVRTPEIKKQIPVKMPVIIPDVLKNRQNELAKSLVLNDPDVTIKIYDNGEIDDDSISVYLDKKLVLSNKRLTANALIVKLKMDEDNPEHELVMVAENLGRIPPNTSLMIVEAGDQRFDVRITSTEQKNAVVRFRYQPN
ncbi:MAG: hypothetical protein ABI480_09240 [Chitinophagaceae bacterium]